MMIDKQSYVTLLNDRDGRLVIYLFTAATTIIFFPLLSGNLGKFSCKLPKVNSSLAVLTKNTKVKAANHWMG